jgi:hypothetical protein
MTIAPKLEITPAPIQPEDLLTPAELAERLKVPLSWIWEQTRRRNRSKNSLPTIYLSPKVVRFSWTAVSAWIQNKD